VAVYIFMYQSASTFAAAPNFCRYTHTPGRRHSAEKSNHQVREHSYTFFSTYGTQSRKRSPSLSQTLVLNQIVLCTELSFISALEHYVFHY